jgi:predicted regulator of Ras-like GTPase activity (Roadblock/LC7/MglB family)
VPGGDGLLVVAVADREVDLGLARLELREAASRLLA